MTHDVQSVELPTDVRLQYVAQGDRAGVPVVLLHGVSDSWHSFELVLPHLPESVRAFAVTQRGHGDSSRPERGYRLPDFAADVAAFMDAVGLEAAFVVGHSMSSVIAQRVAVDYPERTSGLVLPGAFANLPKAEAPAELWAAVSEMKDPVDPDFVRAFQESTVAQPVPAGFMETIVQESLKLPARVWKELVGASVQEDFSVQLDRIQAPTLLIWGDRDGVCTRSDQEALLAAIADCRLEVYEGAGHAPHWEQPERFASDLARFVEARAGR